MSAPFRLGAGGAIDRERTLRFRFNGREYSGHPGDTLASALLAHGERLLARSFKYHRPRGLMAAGVEEPNALVQLGRGARSVPNLKATEIELFDGLEARSVNVFPSLRHDLGAAIGAFSRLLPAGFQHKTFFATPWLWQRVFEPVIRRSAGWGRAPDTADPDHYDRMHVHCDVLVVGGGAAGLMAARTAAEGGARVILADDNPTPGGRLRFRNVTFNGAPAMEWIATQRRELDAAPEVRLLTRTAVVGCYDGHYLTALQRFGDEGEASSPARPRQRLWHIRTRQLILATGAHERPLVFANNDRPGIMLAGAVQAYLNHWAVRAGRALLLFCNNDRAYECVLDWLAAGGAVTAVVDSRQRPDGPLIAAVRAHGVEVLSGHAVVDTRGRRGLRRVAVASLDADRATASALRWLDADLLAVSGGYSPAVHLHSHAGGRLSYDPSQCCFRPQADIPSRYCVGGCNGTFDLDGQLTEAHAAGLAAARDSGWPVPVPPELPAVAEQPAAPPEALWCAPEAPGASRQGRRHFVDFQNDSTAADIRLAVREGFESVEHMKRFTLTGFGTDQGKVSNINGLAILAEAVDRPIPDVGTTTFRPPYTPVTFAAMAGRDRGERFDPARQTAIHDEHVAAGAVFEDVGQWKRPWYYPQQGEDMAAAVARECAAVRTGVGVLDASTLGKIDVQGPDAAEFLNRVYTNNWLKLGIGRIRYGVMCGDDGMVLDDGTTARIGAQRYLMTTTTSGAAAVLEHLEDYLQTEWPDLRVRLTSVTEAWSNVAIAGPKSGRVLAELAPEIDLTPAAFPFLSWRDADVAGLPARIFRISFTGELQYEINVPWHYGTALWRAVMAAGAAHGITPYGTETMHVLRAEKGFIIVGQETDGTQTPIDLGLDWAVSGRKDFIGCRSLARPEMQRDDRLQLVALLPEATDRFVPEGTQVVECGTDLKTQPVPMIGHVTSSYWSPVLERHFALALIAGGRQRRGERVEAALPDGALPMVVHDAVIYDPEGTRRDG